MGSKRKRSAQQSAPSNAPPSKKQQTLPALDIDVSPFLDDPKGVDRKRQADLYSLLGDEDADQRLLAAEAYLKCLLGGAGVSEPTLIYHLNRLLGGLATSRKGSRIGYSLVLMEVLGQLFGGAGNLAAEKYNGLTFESVLEILVVRMRPEGDASGQETEHMLGLLFGLQSFVDAKILFNEDETCTRWNSILEKLLELAKKKPWIREACGKVIVKALEQMPRQAQAEFTLNTVYDAGLALTSDGVGIWITAKQRFPNLKTKSKPWGNNADPLQNLRLLARAMKESPDKEAKADKIQLATQTGSWNPQLHFVWTILLNVLVNPAKKEKQGSRDEFETFWKVVVDENLFGTNVSRERKYWGFLLFQKVLQNAEIYGHLVECIFSRNLVRCLINSVKDEERFLYHAAKKTLEALEHAVEAYRPLLPIILPHLIGGYGKYNFDGLTKTKTVDKLLLLTTVDTNDSTISQVMSVLLEPVVVIEGSEAVQEAESRRQTFGDYLHSLLNLIRRSDRATPFENHNWIKKHVLPTLADFAYGTKIARENKTFQPPITEKTRNLFRDRLMSAFTPLLTDLNGYHYPCDLLVEITCREQNALAADLVSEFRSYPRHATIEDHRFDEDDSWNVVQMDGKVSAAKNKATITMMKILNNISAQKTENRNITARLQALSILHALVLFQLYNGDPEAVSILDELKLCYDGLVGRKATETSKTETSEVLVELLLSFISKPSVLLRKVSNLVFTAFVDEMTEGCLTLMTDVLGSSESLKGQQELFDQEPENEDDMDVDGNEEELDSDVEVIDGDADNEVHDDELDSDVEVINAEDVDEDDNEGKEDDEENKKLDEALAKALGTRKLNLDGEGDGESESDADMSDSEMMALDSKLVEIFSQRKKEPSKKKEKKEAKETMVNFKSRVLDLLEIYVKRQPTNPLACELLLPLLNLIRSTNTPELTQKASRVISSFAKAAKKARKGKSQDDVSVKEQIKLIKAIHTEATESKSHALAKAASTASLLIASSLLRADKKNFKKISKVYLESQGEIEAGRAYMQPSFMDEWNNWVQSQASNISTN